MTSANAFFDQPVRLNTTDDILSAQITVISDRHGPW